MRLGGISDPRNKALMKMFNLLKIGERAGSGVPSILDVWQQQGWQEPVFTEDSNPDRFSVTLMMIQKNDTVKNSRVAKNVAETSEYVAENVAENVVENSVSDAEYRLLELLMMNPGQTVAAYAEQLKVSGRTVDRSLKSLKEKGIIIRIGSARKGYWRIERGV